MQIAYMFIDWGAGWTPLNDHTRDVAALDSLSIRWGTDDITEQPEPSVMNFTLHDRTGWLTGRALTLAGAQIVLQVSGQPTWGMLRTDQGTWAQQTALSADCTRPTRRRSPTRRNPPPSPCSMASCPRAAKPRPIGPAAGNSL